MEPTCVSFRLSPSYGILTALEAHEWFLRMMQEHEQFEVEGPIRPEPDLLAI